MNQLRLALAKHLILPSKLGVYLSDFVKISTPNPQNGALHRQANGRGQLPNEVSSAFSLFGALRTFLQGRGTPAKVIEGTPPGLLHLGQEFPLLEPIFVGHAVAKRIGREVPFVDQLVALFVRELGSHGFTSIFVSLGAGVTRLPALPVNLFPPRLLLRA